jgi:hypothetical protein
MLDVCPAIACARTYGPALKQLADEFEACGACPYQALVMFLRCFVPLTVLVQLKPPALLRSQAPSSMPRWHRSSGTSRLRRRQAHNAVCRLACRRRGVTFFTCTEPGLGPFNPSDATADLGGWL